MCSFLRERAWGALVQTPTPVNKYPEFTRYSVQRLKVLCPSMGKLKIAQGFCRAGLHPGATTVGRILKEPPHPKPAKQQAPTQPTDQILQQVQKPDAKVTKRVVTAKRIHHVWHVDLTLVPAQLGFWTSWLPFSLPPRWPFGYWVAVVIDHFSHRAMGSAVFKADPDPHKSAPSWDARCIRPRPRRSTSSLTRASSSGAALSRTGASGKGSGRGLGRSVDMAASPWGPKLAGPAHIL